MKTHTGLKTFTEKAMSKLKCEFCGYASPFPDRLKRHLWTHAGEKPYECEMCDFKCARSDNFEKHMKTHTGLKTLAQVCIRECQKNHLNVKFAEHVSHAVIAWQNMYNHSDKKSFDVNYAKQGLLIHQIWKYTPELEQVKNQ